MKTELTRNMYILLSKFAKENDIKMEDKEFISALKSVLMNIVHDNTNQTFVRNTNFSKLHEKIMQQCIDFVRENPDVQQEIENKIDIASFNPRSHMGSDSEISLIVSRLSCFNPRSHMGSDCGSA